VPQTARSINGFVHMGPRQRQFSDLRKHAGGAGMNLNHMRPGYQSVAKSIGYALTLEHPDAWQGLPVILRARLDERERGMMAYTSLRAMDADNAAAVARAFLGGSGMPGAPLFNHMDEAAFWADMAEPAELDAYALASFNRMAPARQTAFLNFIQRRAAA
jgi:hypothetical protein